MRRCTLPLSRPTVPTIGGRSLSYVPWPRCLLARRRAGSVGSRCASLFFPRIPIQLIRLRLFIVIQGIIRLRCPGVGLYVLTDKLRRLPTHADFSRQDLRLFAFDYTPHQQDDLLRLQAPSFKDRPALHVRRLVTSSPPIIRYLATFRHPESPCFLQGCSTMRTRHALRMKVLHQPFITVLARHQLDDRKLNWHDPPLTTHCPEFTILCTCP